MKNEWLDLNEITVEQAMNTIAKAIKEDEGYAIGWKANIAMAFYDELYKFAEGSPNSKQLETVKMITSKAADRFIKNAFNVDTSEVPPTTNVHQL